jgi:hypothetical protein
LSHEICGQDEAFVDYWDSKRYEDASGEGNLLETLHLARVKEGTFVAFMGVAPQGLHKNDDYEVDKLRGKRLRIFESNSKDAKEFNLETDHNDKWVQRFKKV